MAAVNCEWMDGEEWKQYINQSLERETIETRTIYLRWGEDKVSLLLLLLLWCCIHCSRSGCGNGGCWRDGADGTRRRRRIKAMQQSTRGGGAIEIQTIYLRGGKEEVSLLLLLLRWCIRCGRNDDGNGGYPRDQVHRRYKTIHVTTDDTTKEEAPRSTRTPEQYGRKGASHRGSPEKSFQTLTI